MNRHGVPNMVISVVTGPFLLALLGARALSQALIQVGIASEELFRGERLPVLQTPPDALLNNDDVDAE